ncbi:LPS-assembly protein LptD [Idiomarina seosinensis]|uniref:LPS-assembly protein LptD n=1 Tax=Idiomarina seosinensis TaxID=281739 RepID=UPI00384AB089
MTHTLLSLCLFAPPAAALQSNANTTSRDCRSPGQSFEFEAPDFDSSLKPGSIAVYSDRAEIFTGQSANFTGDVLIQRNNQWLITESASIDQSTRSIRATEGVRFTDGFIQVSGQAFLFDGEQEQAQLTDTEYQMANTNARGRAEQLNLSAQRVSLLNSSFTTCPSNDPAWQLTAERIEITETSDYGKAWGAKLELFDVPVFYLPYFTFPVTDQRKSGLLFPTIDSSSNNGLEIETPYYLNIAENMDATIAPVWMSERGLMVKGEYRYLFSQTSGQINLEFLPSDNARADGEDRYLWHVSHSTDFAQDWSAFIDATHISDDNYLTDFGSDFAGRADTHLYRVAQVDYNSQSLHFRIRSEDYKLLGQYRSPYRTLPQLSLTFHQPEPTGLSWSWYNELTYFQNQEQSNRYATRLHTAPSVSYTIEQPAYDAEAEFNYLVTHYRQQSDLPLLQERVTRSLPRARVRGRLHLERYFESSGSSMRQTLEPQIQYLYVPYENQQNIGIYDTSLMQDDYHGLFRAQRFSGLDRIAEANQVTYGASSSIFNQKERELLRVNLGQIYYFSDSRTQLLSEQTQVTSSNSEWVADLNWSINPNWSLRSAIQYDTELNRTRKSQTALEYRLNERKLLQVNHRKATNIFNNDIEQVGSQAVWELSKQWQVAANVYYDLANDRVNDAIVGVQYSSCCWAVRVSAYRRIHRDLEADIVAGAVTPNLSTAEFDNGVSLQFIISGLGTDSSSLIEMLEKSIYGYRRPFYLSN